MEHCRFAAPLSSEAYARCFASFKQISNEWEAMLRWLREELLERLSPQEPLRVLSVGSGTGDFDFRLLEVLRRKYTAIEYVTIEPNPLECRELEQRIVSHPESRVHFEVCPVTFEAFTTRKRFDLIHLTHCLYYIPDHERAIRACLELLTDHGRALIFQNTPKGINQIQHTFMKRVKGAEAEMFSSKEIERILRDLGITYQLDIIDSFLDVTPCFQAASETGEDLWCFFLECDVRPLLPEIRGEIVNYLEGLCLEEGGCKLLYNPVAVFSLFK